VMFHPNALRESTFSLPLTPLDVDIVRSLTQISRRLLHGKGRVQSI
jgi:hypothetical protein